jgi:ketosteroid isomerase-like protein
MHFLSKITAVLTLSAFIHPILAQCSDNNQTTSCLCAQNQPSTTYPNQCQISGIFDYLAQGNFTAFLSKVAPDVSWTLMGTHPLAGVYHNKTIFAIDALARLSNTLDSTQPTKLDLTHIIGGGNSEWSLQELHGLGVCKNGKLLTPCLAVNLYYLQECSCYERNTAKTLYIGLIYDNKFAWLTRWNTLGIIVEVRAYLDSALVQRAITENESVEYNYTDQRLVLAPGPVGSNCAA